MEQAGQFRFDGVQRGQVLLEHSVIGFHAGHLTQLGFQTLLNLEQPVDLTSESTKARQRLAGDFLGHQVHQLAFEIDQRGDLAQET